MIENVVEMAMPLLLQKVTDAFNNNDIEAVMNCFAPNAIFDHASGPEVHGTRYEGHDELRRVFSALFDTVQTVSWETVDERICGNKAYCEYIRRATFPNGERQEFLSVDILTFKAGLITHKNTYYKNRTE